MAGITIERVSKVYGDGTLAVDDLNLEVEDGEFVVLVGPSGCGKTTALRMVAGLEEITEGSVHVGETLVNDLPPKDRDIAMVFQNYALYPHMTAADNIGFGLKMRGVPKREIDRQVTAAAKVLGLEEVLRKKPRTLSGGQRQRVAMGRAIVREPKAFLMDEPLSNLDAKLRVGMRTSLQQLHARLATTTIYVTHDQVEAMTLGQRVAVMQDGRLQQVDPPQRLYEDPANLFVAAFIGSPAMNLIETNVGGDAVDLGGNAIPLDRERRPRFARDGNAIVGIRPEAFEDAAFSASGLPQVDVRVEVIEELGSDAHLFFQLPGVKPVVVDEAVRDEEGEDATLLVDAADTFFTARVDARTKVRVGETIRLSVDPSRFYFFSPETGESLLRAAA